MVPCSFSPWREAALQNSLETVSTTFKLTLVMLSPSTSLLVAVRRLWNLSSELSWTASVQDVEMGWGEEEPQGSSAHQVAQS